LKKFSLSTLTRHRDILLVNVLSLILVLTVFLFPFPPFRIVVGALFVLFFPGYTLVSALFPRKKDLEVVEWIALSIGLSLAVTPLIGLVLNYTPWGIRLTPVTFSLLVFTLLMSIIAIYRRNSLPSGEAWIPNIKIDFSKWYRLNKSDKIFTVSLITCIVVAGGLTAYFASTPKIGEKFTEFYVLGENGKIADYPTKLVQGETGKVILGIVNHEYEQVNYTIIVKLNGTVISTINGISLKHEEKWEKPYIFTANKIGEKLKLEFLLYKNNETEPYRKLHLWLTVKPLQVG
jgi:uncharacterized membrane protein